MRIITDKLKSFIHGKGVNVAICVDNHQDTYSTLDSIKGYVSVEAPRDTDFSDVEISLIGKSDVQVELPADSANLSNWARASQAFLELRQPDVRERYPKDLTLRANTVYNFPYNFVVPDRLLDNSCRHLVSNSAVHRAHSCLPPSLGGKTMSKSVRESTSPRTIDIQYAIVAKIRGKGVDVKTQRPDLLVRTERTVSIHPTNPQRTNGTPISRSERLLKKTFLEDHSGTLIMEAIQPGQLNLQPEDGLDGTTATVAVMLRFEPATNASQLPRLDRVDTTLDTFTYYGTKGFANFPGDRHERLGEFERVHCRSMKLGSHAFSGVKWSRCDDNGCAAAPSYMESLEPSIARDYWTTASGPAYKSKSPYYIARVLVHIQLPRKHSLAPSFDTCLISRNYVLTISLCGRSCSCSTNLQLPLSIATRSLQVIRSSEPELCAASPARRVDSIIENLQHLRCEWSMAAMSPSTRPVHVLDELEADTESPPAYSSICHGKR